MQVDQVRRLRAKGGLGSMGVMISSVAAGGVMHSHRQLCRTNADYVAFV
jgi:hypothetical protein